MVEPMLGAMGDRAAGLGGVLTALGEIVRAAGGMVGSLGEAAELETALTRSGQGANALTQCTTKLACCLTRLLCDSNRDSEP
jgi:hypothetical protein